MVAAGRRWASDHTMSRLRRGEKEQSHADAEEEGEEVEKEAERVFLAACERGGDHSGHGCRGALGLARDPGVGFCGLTRTPWT